MNKLGKINIDEQAIKELGSDGQASVTINMEDVVEIEFMHGVIAERPIIQLIAIAVLIPIVIWCSGMFFYDLKYGFPTGNVRPAICGFLMLALSILSGQLALQFVRQPHLHVRLNKGFRKVQFGRGVDVSEIKVFFEKQSQLLKCNVNWSI